MSTKISKFGWKRDLPDQRDYKFSSSKVSFPPLVDLRPKCPSVYDQLDLGSCTANASAGMAHFLFLKEGKPSFVPSRLFVYYNTRVLEGTVKEDSGASLRDTIKTMGKSGCPHENLWWYAPEKYAVKPNKSVYADGSKHLLGEYMSLYQNTSAMKTCLVNGYPFVFGFTVYDSFMKIGKNGVMPMPETDEGVQGGHAVMAVGYDDSRQVFIVRNSWGPKWGDKGYFYMPYDYILDENCDDFWTARVAA